MWKDTKIYALYSREKSSTKSRPMDDPDVTISTKRFLNNYVKNIKKPTENMSMLGKDRRI